MALGPMDLQLNISRSTEIHRISNFDSGKASLFRQHFQDKMREEMKEQEVLVELTQFEKNAVDQDGHQSNSKEQNNKKEKKKLVKKLKSTSMFDRSI